MVDPAVLRHHEILDAAVSDMLAHGVGQLNMQRVAHAAGIAKGTVYLYFPTRDGLTEAALNRALILDEVDAWTDDLAPLTSATLPDFLAELWGALEERDEVVRLVTRAGVDVLSQRARQTLTGFIARVASTMPGEGAAQELLARSLLASVLASYLVDPDPRSLAPLTRLWTAHL